MADQRRKYGDSVLRKCDEHLATQRQHEAEQHAKLEAARQKRQQERELHEAAEVRFVSSCEAYGGLIGMDTRSVLVWRSSSDRQSS